MWCSGEMWLEPTGVSEGTSFSVCILCCNLLSRKFITFFVKLGMRRAHRSRVSRLIRQSSMLVLTLDDVQCWTVSCLTFAVTLILYLIMFMFLHSVMWQPFAKGFVHKILNDDLHYLSSFSLVLLLNFYFAPSNVSVFVCLSAGYL